MIVVSVDVTVSESVTLPRLELADILNISRWWPTVMLKTSPDSLFYSPNVFSPYCLIAEMGIKKVFVLTVQ